MSLKIIFNIPNTIGYIRFILLVASIYVYLPILYSISVFLDLLDGEIARYFSQCTFLGMILDMVVDRLSTIVVLYKCEYSPFLLVLVLIDQLSHFVHFTVSAKQNFHHKRVDGLLQIYYDKRVLVPVCFLSEFFFISYYLKILCN